MLREVWPGLLEEHRHGEGDEDGAHDPESCDNCQLERARRRLSPFERAALAFYEESVSRFSIETGILPGLVAAVPIEGADRALFLRALSEKHEAELAIEGEKLKAARERAQQGLDG